MRYNKEDLISIWIIIVSSIIVYITYHLVVYLKNYSCGININKIPRTYQDIKKNLKTGDLVLLCSKDYIGNLIRFWADDIFTHCGIVVRQNDKLYLWEADVYDNYDYLTNNNKRVGTHLVDLDEKIEDYDGNYGCVYHLNKNITSREMYRVINSLKHTTFQFNCFLWLLAEFKFDLYRNLPIKRNLNSMFCTEAVAYTYKKLKLFKKSLPSYLYQFKDLRSETCFDQKCLMFRF